MTFNKVALLASAQTEFRPSWSGAQHIDLISAVVSAVFKGTGLTLDDVDFVIDSGSDVLDGRSISNCGFLGAMGAHHKEESRVEEDGLWAASYGVSKLAAGAGSVGLIIAYSKPSETSVDAFYATQCEPFYQRPVGFDHLAATGIQAQRYMAQHGVSASDLSGVVAKRWSDASRYGQVHIENVPSSEDVLGDEIIAAPLTRMMLSRPLDGAVAVLLVNESVARRAARNPVWVTGMGNAADGHSFAARKPNEMEACQIAANTAYRQAGWDKAAPSLAEVSASSVVTEALVLESLGLAREGRGIELCKDSGKTEVNRSGGALPADPIMATGLVRLHEAARQLSYPDMYGLKSPSTAIVHGAGGVGMQTHCVFTLEV